MFSVVSFLPAQLKHSFRVPLQWPGEPRVHPSGVAGVKLICHFMELQAIINIKDEETKEKCVLNEEGQDGMAGIVSQLSF